MKNPGWIGLLRSLLSRSQMKNPIWIGTYARSLLRRIDRLFPILNHSEASTGGTVSMAYVFP